MAVFLAGGAGFIGSHMAAELLEWQYDVVVADNYCNSVGEALHRVGKITGRDFAFYECDIRDGAALDRIFNAHNIDCIIHFVGYKAAGESMSIPVEYYANNLNCTL